MLTPPETATSAVAAAPAGTVNVGVAVSSEALTKLMVTAVPVSSFAPGLPSAITESRNGVTLTEVVAVTLVESNLIANW